MCPTIPLNLSLATRLSNVFTLCQVSPLTPRITCVELPPTDSAQPLVRLANSPPLVLAQARPLPPRLPPPAASQWLPTSTPDSYAVRHTPKRQHRRHSLHQSGLLRSPSHRAAHLQQHSLSTASTSALTIGYESSPPMRWEATQQRLNNNALAEAYLPSESHQ